MILAAISASFVKTTSHGKGFGLIQFNDEYVLFSLLAAAIALVCMLAVSKALAVALLCVFGQFVIVIARLPVVLNAIVAVIAVVSGMISVGAIVVGTR